MKSNIYRLYKVANTLYKWKVPLLPKVIYYFMRFAFATSVPYTAAVGRNTYFNNWGLGIVIHRRVVIGENCMISHGVTVGGRGGHYEVPVVGNDVAIGVGAAVLGPIKVGDHAIIGAHALVIHDVPPYAVVAGAPARIIRYNKPHAEAAVTGQQKSA
jgi:serine O-acetyltransferase